LPVPDDPLVIVRNVELLDAVHAQPAWVVTDTEFDPPVPGIVCESGDTVNVHPAPADCVMLTVVPATVSAPVRCVDPLFAATVY